MASSFWNLKVVQLSYRLFNAVYDVTEQFPDKERFRMVDQLCRASLSVPSNISDGEGRRSRPDQAKFLYIARGSLNEVAFLSHLAKDRKYITPVQFTNLDEGYSEVARMLNGLIQFRCG